MAGTNGWDRFRRYTSGIPALGLALDVSRMRFDDAFLGRMALAVRAAFDAILSLRTA